MKEQTLAMIKPDALEKKVQGLIINDILDAGFEIMAMKMLTLTQEQAEAFYAVHKGREFYEPLVKFMISGSIVVLVLEKENAIQDLRDLLGATNSPEALEGTIRNKYGENNRRNAMHGSDSQENAKKEIAFFF